MFYACPDSDDEEFSSPRTVGVLLAQVGAGGAGASAPTDTALVGPTVHFRVRGKLPEPD
ncbi:hypothetical protein Pan44_53650 [Caulifigura coniformis]|uniref:Uncharacterized protein n=1 Tax=Caulifigura coniformis TaxID=2527983 RepID=A0A517SMF4_9PLAN|nr:hypothetical protein Pan44_53650 [Caulifigura coniformis]